MNFKTNLLFVLIVFNILTLEILSFKTVFDINMCTLMYDEGSCDDDILRWWYNKDTKKCETFTYRGCDGNANNFEHEKECERKCGFRLRQYLEYMREQNYSEKILYKEY